jgi:N-acetylneuraminate synthase
MMIISRSLRDFVIGEDEPVEAALQKISKNRRRTVFVVTAEGTLVGSLTDGDFRRWLASTNAHSLRAPVAAAANRDCTWLPESSTWSDQADIFIDGVEVVPLLDKNRHVVGIAQLRTRDFLIADREIARAAPAFLIAEIGINHNGSLDCARRLVDVAVEAGVDCVKFQLRDMEATYRSDTGVAGEDLGAQYTIDLIRETALSVDDTLQALDYARDQGVVPLCTPWDMKSAAILDDYGVPAFKIASADLTNHPLVEALAGSGKPLIVSTGMSTEKEISETIGVLQEGVGSFALLQCSSSYPAPFKDLNLHYMRRLSTMGDCHVGYSGHERGHHVAVAAVALGARIVEKHITLDRAARGNDHRVSLEPAEFRQMVSEIRDIEAALGEERPRQISQGESLNRLSLGKSLVAARDMAVGETVQLHDVVIRSPGRGLQPNSLHRLIGVRLLRPVGAGDFFYHSDVDATRNAARNYAFSRDWGLPVRFHDWRDLAAKSNPDFLEFHLSYRDLEVEIDAALDESMSYGLVVHSPDLLRGDMILDLASDDDDIRGKSIAELQRVVDLTRNMRPRFNMDKDPLVVASLGGSTLDSPVPAGSKEEMYARVAASLSQLDLDGVNLLAQTLPPYPWYLGGQRHCNLFVDPVETVQFAADTGIELCFDVAHTKLATNHARTSFSEAAAILLPHTAHLHLVDAAGIDDEGLQILDGEVDWKLLASQMADLAPQASFIPEIWQGHVAGGQGFWVALDRLERLLT